MLDKGSVCVWRGTGSKSGSEDKCSLMSHAGFDKMAVPLTKCLDGTWLTIQTITVFEMNNMSNKKCDSNNEMANGY